MKTALIVALCAGALIQSAPLSANARARAQPAPVFALGSVAFKKLPKPVKHALEDYRRAERRQPYRCYGLSQDRFEERIGLLAPMDYNGDGALDYLFNSPCRPRTLPAAADILMSNPLGYEVSTRFDAFVDVVNGHPALLVETSCEEGSREAEDGRACYVARIWNRDTGRWAGAQRVYLALDASGFIVAPLEVPRLAAGPAPIAVAPLSTIAAPPAPAPFLIQPVAPQPGASIAPGLAGRPPANEAHAPVPKDAGRRPRG